MGRMGIFLVFLCFLYHTFLFIRSARNCPWFFFILYGSAIRGVDGCVFSCRGFIVLFMSYIFIYLAAPIIVHSFLN